MISTSPAALLSARKTLVAAALLLGMISTAQAYSAEQEALCTSDAFRLCSSEIPNVDAVTACMVKNKAKLSVGCKSVFHATPATTTTAQATAVQPRGRMTTSRASPGGRACEPCAPNSP